MRPGDFQDIEGVPLHVYRDAGETRSQPCAEVLLTFEAAERILDSGLMPLLSFKDRDSVRLARFQSVADPLAPLSGWWS
jgi:type VI secretion system protein ImpC